MGNALMALGCLIMLVPVLGFFVFLLIAVIGAAFS